MRFERRAGRDDRGERRARAHRLAGLDEDGRDGARRGGDHVDAMGELALDALLVEGRALQLERGELRFTPGLRRGELPGEGVAFPRQPEARAPQRLQPARLVQRRLRVAIHARGGHESHRPQPLGAIERARGERGARGLGLDLVLEKVDLAVECRAPLGQRRALHVQRRHHEAPLPVERAAPGADAARDRVSRVGHRVVAARVDHAQEHFVAHDLAAFRDFERFHAARLLRHDFHESLGRREGSGDARLARVVAEDEVRGEARGHGEREQRHRGERERADEHHAAQPGTRAGFLGFSAEEGHGHRRIR